MPETLADKIIAAGAAGISQGEIAERTGVSHSVICRLARGHCVPKTQFVASAIEEAIVLAHRCLEERKAAVVALAAMTSLERNAIAARLGFAPQTVRNWSLGTLPPWRKIAALSAELERRAQNQKK